MALKKNEAKQFNKLIKSIASKDETALEVFYEKYGRLIYATALAITKSSYLADEVANDVLVKVWQVSGTLHEIKTPMGWLYTVTANCAKDKLRGEFQVYPEFQDVSETGINEILDEDEFYYYISFLSESEKQIMIFRFVEDLSFKLIAKEMGMPLSSVTASYYRALEKIKKNKFS